ncbi:hypothetical protein PRIPAC_87281 [Pristionchus pacificus]|uniref:Uncharacterized protein n=1 Tax=Pristionchus pacificus TaxID=54126 RepID=A0A2A6CVZ9_PRIPA|nr:hypothetical protein PRIPAC_87281 [Pristionchus pacificus]|eukprot:PDM82256.1 hypothetical protein PRIPAC_36649 [Pristionchus pacificus]
MVDELPTVTTTPDGRRIAVFGPNLRVFAVERSSDTIPHHPDNMAAILDQSVQSLKTVRSKHEMLTIARKCYLEGLRSGKTKPHSRANVASDPDLFRLATFHYKLNVEKTLALRTVMKNMQYIDAHLDVVNRLGNPGIAVYNQIQVLTLEAHKDRGPRNLTEMAIYEATHGRKFAGTIDEFMNADPTDLYPDQITFDPY